MDGWWQSHPETVGLATLRLLDAASIRLTKTLRDAVRRRPWPALGLLAALEPRMAEILRLRFGLEDGRRLTLDQIGRRFKLTRERIRQLEK